MLIAGPILTLLQLGNRLARFAAAQHRSLRLLAPRLTNTRGPAAAAAALDTGCLHADAAYRQAGYTCMAAHCNAGLG